MTTKTSSKTYIKMLIGALLILISAYFAVRYAIYRFNEYRGFCTAESKYLNDEEMRQAFITDFIVFKMDFKRIEAHSHKAQVYISKYDLTDAETIIDVMANANFTNGFDKTKVEGAISKPKKEGGQDKPENYEVVAHYTNRDDESGFSGTLFT